MTGLEDPKQLHPSPAISQAMLSFSIFPGTWLAEWWEGF